jgi:methylmalonyl-CoA/ethylmalonyl-CoA epimerase
MIKGIHHIGIAVSDLEQAIPLWVKAFGGTLEHREVVADQKVEVAVVMVGSLRIELIAAVSAESPVARFIASRGAGIHHIALESLSTQEELDRMRDAGVQLIDRTARSGGENTRIGFVHPRALGGVLVEVVESSQGT